MSTPAYNTTVHHLELRNINPNPNANLWFFFSQKLARWLLLPWKMLARPLALICKNYGAFIYLYKWSVNANRNAQQPGCMFKTQMTRA